jgi:hypothetical protein
VKKHRIDKIRQVSGASVELCPPDTPEEMAAFIAELVAIGEKLPSGSVSGESLSDIIADYKKPRSIIVNDVKGNRVSVASGVTEIISGADAPTSTKNDLSDAEKKIPENLTLYNSGDAEILDKKNLTLYNSGDAEKTDSGKNKFTDLELELIRQIEDAEQ